QAVHQLGHLVRVGGGHEGAGLGSGRRPAEEVKGEPADQGGVVGPGGRLGAGLLQPRVHRGGGQAGGPLPGGGRRPRPRGGGGAGRGAARRAASVRRSVLIGVPRSGGPVRGRRATPWGAGGRHGGGQAEGGRTEGVAAPLESRMIVAGRAFADNFLFRQFGALLKP